MLASAGVACAERAPFSGLFRGDFGLRRSVFPSGRRLRRVFLGTFRGGLSFRRFMSPLGLRFLAGFLRIFFSFFFSFFFFVRGLSSACAPLGLTHGSAWLEITAVHNNQARHRACMRERRDRFMGFTAVSKIALNGGLMRCSAGWDL